MAQLGYNDYLQQLNYSFDNSEQIIKKQIQKLDYDIATLDNKLLLVKKDVSANNKTIEELQITKTENSKQVNNLADNNKELLNNLSTLKTKHIGFKEQKAQLADICKEHKTFETLIEKLKNKNEISIRDISNRDTQFNSLKTDVESLKKDAKFHENLSILYSNTILEKTKEELKKLKQKNANLQRKITIRKNKSLSDNPSISESITHMKDIDIVKNEDNNLNVFGICFVIVGYILGYYILVNYGSLEVKFDSFDDGWIIIPTAIITVIMYPLGVFIGTLINKDK